MKNGASLRVLAALLALAGLSACDTIKSVAGLGDTNARQQSLDGADEFSSKRPPLTLPPDYSLRPPSNAGTTTDFTAAQQGRQAVFGLNQDKNANVQRKAGRTVGESHCCSMPAPRRSIQAYGKKWTRRPQPFRTRKTPSSTAS